MYNVACMVVKLFEEIFSVLVDIVIDVKNISKYYFELFLEDRRIK